MSPRAIGILVKIAAALFVAIFCAVLWYYTVGRKPKLVLSEKFPDKTISPAAYFLGGGEALLLAGTKATLFDGSSGRQKWTVSLEVSTAGSALASPTAAKSSAAIPAPAPPLPPPPATTSRASQASASPSAMPPASSEEKPDPLVAKRVERRFAKLQTWAGKLSAKRTALKNQIQIEAFNEEAAKYHAELVSARAEAATLRKPDAVRPSAVIEKTAETIPSATIERIVKLRESAHHDFVPWEQKPVVIAEGNAIWIAQASRVIALDRADGRTTKDIALGGKLKEVFRGPGCLYVLASARDGARQVTRVGLADGSSKSLQVTGSGGESRFLRSASGTPPTPNVRSERTEFSAAGGEMLQAEIRLVDKKITERQVLSGDSVSDMEEADKKTTGGWSSDAAVFSKALAKDAAREATGGKERTDESTYEITLRRPFATGVSAGAPFRMQGRPDVFSTATLDLVVAGQTLIAFDRNNQKLWETKLAHPIALASSLATGGEEPRLTCGATVAQPCFENRGQLYFFDQGFLSAFEAKSGKPLWRIPSIGIRKVQCDGEETLYVTSANGNPESLKYSGAADDSLPLTLKVDAKSGKILWKLEKYQDCFVSGGNVYVTCETRNGEDAVNQVFDRSKAPECRFKLYKLSARSGEPQWEWFQIRRPLHLEADSKRVSLLFRDELQVITSMAL